MSVLCADTCNLRGIDALSDLLVTVSRELCRAGAHDGIGGRDIGLLSPTRDTLVNCSPIQVKSVGRAGRENSLALVELRL